MSASSDVRIGADAPCPCGGGAYGSCCGPFHAGAPAPTAERLMRSRFSAFALGMDAYLVTTWAEETRPPGLDTSDDGIEWRRLLIRDTSAGGPDDATGVVAFTAIARGQEGRIELRERSRFARDASGRWVYVDGFED